MTRESRGQFLAPIGRRKLADEWGYTDLPLGAARHEPEPLSDAEYDEHIKGRAELHARIRRALQIEAARAHRANLPVEQRMLEARRVAKLRHIDVTSEMWTLDAMLERARRGGHKIPIALVEKLERVEARLDGEPLSA